MTEQLIRNLVLTAKNLRNTYNSELERKKENGKTLLARPDFLWHELLVSYSTLGGISGYNGMIEDKSRYQQVTYEELKKLGDNENRVNRLRQVMKEAHVHYYNKKASMLSQCFEKIEAMGGLDVANTTLLNNVCAAEMIEFLADFPGIGPKYARDIMMDSYHPLFHNKIALDSRVRSVSKALGTNFKKYKEHENFYLGVAKQAGIEGWELDRLIFEHTDEFLNALKKC
jgi:hypothetical protein